MTECGDHQPRADVETLATATTPLPTGRLRPLVALLGLFFAQALACTYLSPFGAVSGRGFERFLVYLGGGIVLAQPMLVAMGAVLGPGRWLVRFPCGLAIIGLLGHLAGFGGILRGGPGMLALIWMVFVLAYLLLQPPLIGVRWLRRWRVTLPGLGQASRLGRMQFSLRWLLAVATVACVMLAVARWTYVPYSFPNTEAGWWSLMGAVCLIALVIGGVSLAAVPLPSVAMGTVRRGLSFGLAVVGLMAAAAFLYWLFGPANRDTEWLITCSLPAGWVWILLNLLALRWGGFRLVREPKAVVPPRSEPVDGSVA